MCEDTSGLSEEDIRGPFIEFERTVCGGHESAFCRKHEKIICNRHEKPVCRGHERDNEDIIGSYLFRSCATRQQRNINAAIHKRTVCGGYMQQDKQRVVIC